MTIQKFRLFPTQRSYKQYRMWMMIPGIEAKCFTAFKDMSLQGSTALRVGVELSETLDTFYGTEVPERLYLYADGGGDRRVTHLQGQKALIAVFIHHDLDELIAARPAAYQSYRNPV